MKNIIIDILAPRKLLINDFLYGNKLNLYQTHDLAKYSQQEVNQNLFKLFQDNMIYFENTKDGTNILSLNIHDFQTGFETSILVGLAQQGGEYWEQYYQPNWFNYIDVYYEDKSYTEPVKIELTSMNKYLLLDICQTLNQNKLMIDILDEWEICYWKAIKDIDVFKFTYIAETIDEKILIDDIYSSLYSYKDLFCKDTQHFF